MPQKNVVSYMISNCIAHGHSSQQAIIHLHFFSFWSKNFDDANWHKKTRTNKRPTKQFSNHLELLLCNKEEKKILRKKTSGLLNDGKMEKKNYTIKYVNLHEIRHFVKLTDINLVCIHLISPSSHIIAFLIRWEHRS